MSRRPLLFFTLVVLLGCTSDDRQSVSDAGSDSSVALDATDPDSAAADSSVDGAADAGDTVLNLPTLELPLAVNAIQTLTDTETAPNGAWSWFEDERAIIDLAASNGPLLLVSSVSAGPNGDPESGDIDLLWYNLKTKEQGEFELHNRLDRDDHDSASLYIREDGRYLAMYSTHGRDSFSRWRISEKPHDPTAWRGESLRDNGATTTYSNLHQTDDDSGTTYLVNFTRSVGWNPNALRSDDDGSTWSYYARLFDTSGRPYVKYANDGVGNIHVFYTDQHPRNYDNNIYHLRIFGDAVYDSAGQKVDDFDEEGMAVTGGTRLFEGSDDAVGWVTDLQVDSEGDPYGVFSVQVDGAGLPTGEGGLDHRYYYARLVAGEWSVHPMSYAGTKLYAGEDDYTGLVALDPHDPNCLYISTDADPVTGEPLISSADEERHHELFAGSTNDGGESWTWTPMTVDSSVDNLRPIMPVFEGDKRILAWMRGRYNSFTSWDTEVVFVAWSGGCPG